MEGLLWVRLTDYKYPRTALLLPRKYQKEALCEAHNSIFGGHNASLKKPTSRSCWPGIYQDIKMHVQTCLTCQQRKRSPTKPTPLSPLPIPERPNWRIHADLFGPMLTADSNKKFVLCITDAFTKYAVVTSIQNKNAEIVAEAIFKERFCKFGIPAQIHNDGRKRVREQTFSRNDGAHECGIYKNISSSPPHSGPKCQFSRKNCKN